MSFSKDSRYYAPTPRSLQASKFGPYSRLHVDRRREAKGWLWAIGCGVGVGIAWWLVTAIAAGVR